MNHPSLFTHSEYKPDCERCNKFNVCTIQKELKELRETIFNIGREASGRTDFIKDGKIYANKEVME